MQTPKPRVGSLEVPPRVSPRAARQLKTTTLEPDSAASSNQAVRTPKDRSSKVIERKSPRSPIPEKKRPSKISELETQVSRLQEDLKKTKNQLISSESLKKQAQQDAEESKKQLLALTSKLEDSKKQLLEQSNSEEARVAELEKISQEKDLAWESELATIKKHNSVNSSALSSALNEIEELKAQLERSPKSVQPENAGSADTELNSLKEHLAETLSEVENMRTQLKDCKKSEAQAQSLVSETLMQLETAKRTVEVLRAEGMKVKEAHNSVVSELEQSKTQVSLLNGVSILNGFVNTGNSGFCNGSNDISQTHEADPIIKIGVEEKQKLGDSKDLEAELSSLRSEVGRLRCTLETAEIKHHEEQIHSTVQIRTAYELVEQMKTSLSLREGELEAELEKRKADIEELKANLMDKETELQGIAEENEGLNLKLRKSSPCHQESELEREFNKLREDVTDLKASLMARESEMHSILDDNKMLRLEVKKREVDRGVGSENVVSELEAARAAEQEAVMKLGFVMEEADKSNRRATRISEQLEATQAASCEMEAELRRLKVQSDQWRKAAEAAAAMISSGNNGKFVERTGSMDNNYNPGKLCPPYTEDMDDDLLKKKNGNVLKKIGVLWKKPQK